MSTKSLHPKECPVKIPRGYTPVPNGILTHPLLSPLEVRCFAVLLTHCRPERDGWYRTNVGNATLGREIGCGPRQASRLIASLEAKELLQTETTPHSRITQLYAIWDGMIRPEGQEQDDEDYLREVLQDAEDDRKAVPSVWTVESMEEGGPGGERSELPEPIRPRKVYDPRFTKSRFLHTLAIEREARARCDYFRYWADPETSKALANHEDNVSSGLANDYDLGGPRPE